MSYFPFSESVADQQYRRKKNKREKGATRMQNGSYKLNHEKMVTVPVPEEGQMEIAPSCTYRAGKAYHVC